MSLFNLSKVTTYYGLSVQKPYGAEATPEALAKYKADVKAVREWRLATGRTTYPQFKTRDEAGPTLASHQKQFPDVTFWVYEASAL